MDFYTRQDTLAFEDAKFLYIKTSLVGHIFTITLDRPEKRNAFTPTMAAEIIFALAFAHYHEHVRCVVINANGPVFCAGADLIAFHNSTVANENPTLPEIREEARLGDAFRALLKPSIAKVKGPVLAGGFLIICGCHFVVSTPDATFSLPEVTRGIWPMQVMASLSRILPDRKVLELAITGKSYSSQEALALGLISNIHESEKIDIEVDVLAKLICENAPLAIQAGMSAFQKMKEFPEAERHAFLKTQLDLLLKTEDAEEGSLAFKEKRKPEWKGR